MSKKMERTRELKQQWNELKIKLYEKLGVMEIDGESIFISEMLLTAIRDDKPLSDNEIETIECIMRVKMFKHNLL